MTPFEYLPSTQCPCCKMYYVIKCSHAQTGSQQDKAEIFFSSEDRIELKAIDNEDSIK